MHECLYPVGDSLHKLLSVSKDLLTSVGHLFKRCVKPFYKLTAWSSIGNPCNCPIRESSSLLVQ